MQMEINTIDLAIENLDASHTNFLIQAYSDRHFKTPYGEMLKEWSYEMWLLSRDMKKFKEEYVAR